MQEQLIDLSYLYEVSDNDPRYIYDVIEIFLSTSPAGLVTLEKLVAEGKDYDAIHKQAHFLKSSFGIIKVNGVFDRLVKMDAQARILAEAVAQKNNATPEQRDAAKEDVARLMTEIKDIFQQAHPLIIAEMNKYAAG